MGDEGNEILTERIRAMSVHCPSCPFTNGQLTEEEIHICDTIAEIYDEYKDDTNVNCYEIAQAWWNHYASQKERKHRRKRDAHARNVYAIPSPCRN